jgi:hypothetical protein
MPGGHRGGEHRRHGRAGGRRRAPAAREVFPGGPLLGAALHDALAGDHVGEVIGVGSLAGDLGGSDAEEGGVTGDGGLEFVQLSGEQVVVGLDVVGFRHGVLVSFFGLGRQAVGRRCVAGIARFEDVRRAAPAEVRVVPAEVRIPMRGFHGGGEKRTGAVRHSLPKAARRAVPEGDGKLGDLERGRRWGKLTNRRVSGVNSCQTETCPHG